MKLVRPAAADVRRKFAHARRELSAALIERDDEVDLVLTALVANEHVLLVGPPAVRRVCCSTRSWHGQAARSSRSC